MSKDTIAAPETNNVYPKDDICLLITNLVQKEGKLSLNQIIQKTHLCKQTTHNHLKHLLRDAVLTRQAEIQGKGRPTIYYKRTTKPLKQVKGEVVSITFTKLQKFCKQKNKYYCQEKNKECSISICPAILK